MKKLCAAFLAGSALFFSSGSAWSHHTDPTANLATGGSSGVSVSSGGMIQIGHEEPAQILIAVAYPGQERHTGNHHVFYRYFWVSARAFVTSQPGEEQPFLQSLALNIVPVTKVTTSHDGITRSVRHLPIEIRRDIDAGMKSSVSVQAVGWARYSESAWSGEASEHEVARVVKFAQIAVDVLGLRLANLEGRGLFVGGQVGSVQGEAGLGWNLNEKASLRVSLGGRASLAAGSETGAGQMAMIAEGDAFARIQLLLSTTVARFTLFAEGGYHQLSLLEPGHPHDDEEAGSDHEHGHGHPYVLIGLGAAF